MSPETEIQEARRVLDERKVAAGLGEAFGAGPDEIEAAIRGTFSGLDVDLEELQEASASVRRVATVAGMLMPPAAIAAGTFIDGVALGLTLAQVRKRREARA